MQAHIDLLDSDAYLNAIVRFLEAVQGLLAKEREMQGSSLVPTLLHGLEFDTAAQVIWRHMRQMRAGSTRLLHACRIQSCKHGINVHSACFLTYFLKGVCAAGP